MAKINSKQKGSRGELEFANLCKQYGFDTRRGQQFCGANGDADVVGLPNIHIEVKRVEALNIYKAIEKTLEDKKEQDLGIVAHRKNNQEWLITMTFEEWMEIYKRYLLTL